MTFIVAFRAPDLAWPAKVHVVPRVGEEVAFTPIGAHAPRNFVVQQVRHIMVTRDNGQPSVPRIEVFVR